MTALNQVLAYPAGNAEARLEVLVDAHVDLPALVDRAFGSYIKRTLEDYRKVMTRKQLEVLAGNHQRRLVETFRRRLITDLATWARSGEVGSLRMAEADLDGRRGSLSVRGSGPAGNPAFELRLRQGDAGWRIEDIESADKKLSRAYRDRYRDIIGRKYSLAVLTARLEEREYIVLEDFATTPAGGFPQGWGWRSKDDRKPKPYEVRGHGDGRHLAAVDTGSSVIIMKYAHWDPIEYPIMTWCWRADLLPPNGDERYTPTNDSAAGWYVIFSQNWLGIPRQIKYVWSTTLPVGTVDRRDMWARPYFFVVESGDERLGRWTFEQVDIVTSYQRVYGGRPKDRTLGIGLLTDANSTDSRAEARYADLRVWPRAAAESGRIEDYCSCLEDDK